MLTLNFLEILRFEMGFTGGVIVDTAGESHGNSEFPTFLDEGPTGEQLPCIYQGLVLGKDDTLENHTDYNLASIYEVHPCPTPSAGELLGHWMYTTKPDFPLIGRNYMSIFYYPNEAQETPEIKELGYITMAGTNVLLERKTIGTITLLPERGCDPPCPSKGYWKNRIMSSISFWVLESVSNNTGLLTDFIICLNRLFHVSIYPNIITLVTGEEHVLDFAYDELIKIDAGAEESNWGLVLGTGEQVFIPQRIWALVSPISEGTGVGQLEHAEVTAGDCHTYGSQIYFDVIRVFTNNSGADIIVSEVGLIAKNLYLLAYGTFSPLIIEDGESFTMKFRIQV